MAHAAEALPAPTTVRWSAGRWYLAAVAISHTALGIAGLTLDRSFPVGSDATRQAGSRLLFGVLETNGWHSLAALLLGVLAAGVLLLAPGRARPVALYIGAVNAVLALSLLVKDPSTFWIASNAADQVIHFTTAVAGIVTGLLKSS
jgi:hypothetical protein